jgi:hypothetical protein
MPVEFRLPLYKSGNIIGRTVIVNGQKLVSGGKIRNLGMIKATISGENRDQVVIRGPGGKYVIGIR